MLSSLFNYFKSKLPNTATIKTTVMYAWSWTKTTTVMYSWSLYEKTKTTTVMYSLSWYENTKNCFYKPPVEDNNNMNISKTSGDKVVPEQKGKLVIIQEKIYYISYYIVIYIKDSCFKKKEKEEQETVETIVNESSINHTMTSQFLYYIGLLDSKDWSTFFNNSWYGNSWYGTANIKRFIIKKIFIDFNTNYYQNEDTFKQYLLKYKNIIELFKPDSSIFENIDIKNKNKLLSIAAEMIDSSLPGYIKNIIGSINHEKFIIAVINYMSAKVRDLETPTKSDISVNNIESIQFDDNDNISFFKKNINNLLYIISYLYNKEIITTIKVSNILFEQSSNKNFQSNKVQQILQFIQGEYVIDDQKILECIYSLMQQKFPELQDKDIILGLNIYQSLDENSQKIILNFIPAPFNMNSESLSIIGDLLNKIPNQEIDDTNKYNNIYSYIMKGINILHHYNSRSDDLSEYDHVSKYDLLVFKYFLHNQTNILKLLNISIDLKFLTKVYQLNDNDIRFLKKIYSLNKILITNQEKNIIENFMGNLNISILKTYLYKFIKHDNDIITNYCHGRNAKEINQILTHDITNLNIERNDGKNIKRNDGIFYMMQFLEIILPNFIFKFLFLGLKSYIVYDYINKGLNEYNEYNEYNNNNIKSINKLSSDTQYNNIAKTNNIDDMTEVSTKGCTDDNSSNADSTEWNTDDNIFEYSDKAVEIVENKSLQALQALNEVKIRYNIRKEIVWIIILSYMLYRSIIPNKNNIDDNILKHDDKIDNIEKYEKDVLETIDT